MVDAFATPQDLATRLGVTLWTGTELAQVQALLEDASDHLRSIIGWQVYPAAEVTETLWDFCGQILDLPGSPVTEVSAVTVDAVAVDPSAYTLVNGRIRRTAGSWFGDVVVTYTVGYATAPADLASWTCVLASQALSTLQDLQALGGTGVSSIAIDDFRKSWADGGDAAGFSLPERNEDRLRRQYGGGVYVTGSSR